MSHLHFAQPGLATETLQRTKRVLDNVLVAHACAAAWANGSHA
ncbi:hypothetical protein GGR61_002762 [Xanthomonas arboricola]|nr:hypothetical protein [Xanthomonas sp. 3058]